MKIMEMVLTSHDCLIYYCGRKWKKCRSVDYQAFIEPLVWPQIGKLATLLFFRLYPMDGEMSRLKLNNLVIAETFCQLIKKNTLYLQM